MSESKSNLIPNMASIINAIYPVGSYYWSDRATSPADLWKVGTWERIKDKFVLAAGDTYIAGSTGGEATHTITKDETPSYHIGDIPAVVPMNHTNWNNGGIGGVTVGTISPDKPGTGNLENTTSGAQYGWAVWTDGGGKSHNNMPPYITVYCWHRTA